jgi:hypothetical protein
VNLFSTQKAAAYPRYQHLFVKDEEDNCCLFRQSHERIKVYKMQNILILR